MKKHLLTERLTFVHNSWLLLQLRRLFVSSWSVKNRSVSVHPLAASQWVTVFSLSTEMPSAVIAVGRPGVGDSGRAPRKRKDYVGGRRSSWPCGRVEEDSGFHKARSSHFTTLHKLVFKECGQITSPLFRYRYSTGSITEFAPLDSRLAQGSTQLASVNLYTGNQRWADRAKYHIDSNWYWYQIHTSATGSILLIF